MNFFSKKIQNIREKWFPSDTISLSHVLRETFWVETSRPIVRLMIAIFISAFFLVLVKNAYHQAFMRLQALKVEQSQLHTEWMQLLIEEGTWGNYDRVSEIATTTLGMAPPTPFNIQILTVKNQPSYELQSLIAASALDKVFFDPDGYLIAAQNQ